MKNTALITGASGGLGAAFAKLHAQRGGDLVLVARNETKLDAIKAELANNYNCEIFTVVADLSKPSAAQEIFKATEAEGVEVDILINNAGFGGYGDFYQRDLDLENEMIQVNISALVNLTHFYLKGMVDRNCGRILQIASSAAFLPGPKMAVYYASKSFVVSFSQAIAQELSGTGVTSTVLCPGPIATEFANTANLDNPKVFEKADSPQAVAKCGYEAMLKGKLVVNNDAVTHFALTWILPLLPRKWLLAMSEKALSR